MYRLAVLSVLLATTAATADEKPMVLNVWPDKVPGEKGEVGEEKVLELQPGQKPVKRVTNVTVPTLTVFRPAKDRDTGAAVVIAPGGGYNILAWDLEGEEVAAWLNSVGVAGGGKGLGGKVRLHERLSCRWMERRALPFPGRCRRW